VLLPLDFPLNKRIVRLEHYIVKAMKHAVFGPFSNEAREKSSISRLKARERFEKDTKKAPEPQVPAPVEGRYGGRKITKTQKVRALPPLASITCPVTQRAFGPARNDTTSAMSRAKLDGTEVVYALRCAKIEKRFPGRFFDPQSRQEPCASTTTWILVGPFSPFIHKLGLPANGPWRRSATRDKTARSVERVMSACA
jgi:hypothetical protein